MYCEKCGQKKDLERKTACIDCGADYSFVSPKSKKESKKPETN